MTIISDALIRERSQGPKPSNSSDINARPEPYKPVAHLLSALAGAHGLLAGGYDIPRSGIAPALAPPPKTQVFATRYGRWLMLAGVAGAMAVIIGTLPGVGGGPGVTPSARAAVLHPAKTGQEVSRVIPEIPGNVTPQARVNPAPAEQPKIASAPKAVAATPKTAPITATMILKPVFKSIESAAAPKPDSAPLLVASAATQPNILQLKPIVPIPVLAQPSVKPAVQPELEEVIYEGVPAPGVNLVQKALGPAATTARPAQAIRISDREKDSAAQEGGVRLEGIFYEKTRPMALINGEIVEVGARLGNIEVLEIKPGAVTISDKGLRRVLCP